MRRSRAISRLGPGKTFLGNRLAPGRILAEFGRRLDYEVHGVDYAADSAAIERYLRGHGCTVGEVVRADVFDWDPGRTYDVVSSFGVVEHFDDPGPPVDRHFELAAPGGRVVIGLPNFARGQHLLHWLFDRENLRRHNLRCMSLGDCATPPIGTARAWSSCATQAATTTSGPR